MVLAATPNQHSSGLRRACSTSTIEIDRMALMQCLNWINHRDFMSYIILCKLLVFLDCYPQCHHDHAEYCHGQRRKEHPRQTPYSA